MTTFIETRGETRMLRYFLLAGTALVMTMATPARAANENWLTRYEPPVSPESQVGVVSRDDSVAVRPAEQKAQVVIRGLKGVVFVGTPGAVKKRGAKASGVVVGAEPVPDGARAEAEARLGKTLTLGDLDDLTRSLVMAYRDADRPVVNVVVPEQDVTDGVLQILVVMGRVGKVKVEGPEVTQEDVARITPEIHATPGQPISEGALLDDLRYLNRTPFLQAGVIYQPGKGYGLTDVSIAVSKSKPWMVYGGAETRGDNGPLGVWRPFVGAMEHDLLGFGEVIGYQFTTAKRVDRLASHVVSVALPLPERMQLQAILGHTDTRAPLAAPLSSKGSSDVAGLYLTVPLPHLDRLSHDLRFGVEYKSTDNDLDFGGTRATTGQAVITQGVVGYTGELLSTFGVTRIDGNVYLSSGGLGGNGADADYASLRAGARSRYVYGRATVDHRFEFAGGWKGEAIVTGQAASAPLLPSEMLQFGGLGSVRGFLSGKARADTGVIANLTVSTPTLAALGVSFGGEFTDQIRLYGFLDHASGINRAPSTGEFETIAMTGAGLGVTWEWSRNASVDVGWGWRVQDTGVRGPLDGGALHARAVVRY